MSLSFPYYFSGQVSLLGNIEISTSLFAYPYQRLRYQYSHEGAIDDPTGRWQGIEFRRDQSKYRHQNRTVGIDKKNGYRVRDEYPRVSPEAYLAGGRYFASMALHLHWEQSKPMISSFPHGHLAFEWICDQDPSLVGYSEAPSAHLHPSRIRGNITEQTGAKSRATPQKLLTKVAS